MPRMYTDVRGSWLKQCFPPAPPYFPPFRGIFLRLPNNSTSSISHLPPTHTADFNGRPRNLTESIFWPPRPGFCHLGGFVSVVPNTCPASFIHLPSTHAADVHGRPRILAEADGRNISTTPPYSLSFRGVLFLFPSHSPSPIFRPN